MLSKLSQLTEFPERWTGKWGTGDCPWDSSVSTTHAALVPSAQAKGRLTGAGY